MSLLGTNVSLVCPYLQHWSIKERVRNHLSSPLGFKAERYSMVRPLWLWGCALLCCSEADVLFLNKAEILALVK